jgi:hypothetical protein
MLGLFALVSLISATSDAEILQFASGVLAGSSLTSDATANIGGNNSERLIIEYKLSQYSDAKVGTIGFDLYNIARSAETITAQFPGRFKQVDLIILDSSGINSLGIANIAVN